MFRFLDQSLIRSSYYPEVLSRLKSGQRYLDLGCCFGQEIRQLVFDGVPSENLYASDVCLDFWNLGYELFLDKDKLKATFIPGDVFDPESALKQLDGKVDILHAASFFHLFGYEQQVEVAKRVVKLLRPVPGSLILGRQVGSAKPGVMVRPQSGRTMFRHDERTWTEMWEKVGEELGVKFEVDAKLEEMKEPSLEREEKRGKELQDGTRRLRFVVRLL
jgi:hypothetical protein